MIQNFDRSRIKRKFSAFTEEADRTIKVIVGEDISKVQYRWPFGMPLVRGLGEGMHEVRSLKISRNDSCNPG